MTDVPCRKIHVCLSPDSKLARNRQSLQLNQQLPFSVICFQVSWWGERPMPGNYARGCNNGGFLSTSSRFTHNRWAFRYSSVPSSLLRAGLSAQGWFSPFLQFSLFSNHTAFWLLSWSFQHNELPLQKGADWGQMASPGNWSIFLRSELFPSSPLFAPFLEYPIDFNLRGLTA